MERMSTLVCLLVILRLSNGQDRIIFRDNDDDASVTRQNSLIPMRIPERLLIRLKDVHNTTDLLHRFVVPDRNVIRDNVTSTPAISGRTPLSSAPNNYIHGYCQPMQSIVELETPGNGATYLFPSCVRIRRCGGCCTSKLLTCTPVKTSSIVVMVTQLVYNFNPEFPDAFEDHSIRSFTLEQHDQCVCKCAVQPEDCGPLQEYREDECQCICSNQQQASQCTGSKRIWDNAECSCRCRQVLDCSTGFQFHPRKCRCERIRNNRAGNLEIRNATSSERSISLSMNTTISNTTHSISVNT